jgi:hypothetical protein
MTANDSLKGTAIGTASQAVRARATNATAFGKGRWTWILVVGVALMLPRPARTQTKLNPLRRHRPNRGRISGNDRRKLHSSTIHRVWLPG